jgi:hypothetical protein
MNLKIKLLLLFVAANVACGTMYAGRTGLSHREATCVLRRDAREADRAAKFFEQGPRESVTPVQPLFPDLAKLGRFVPSIQSVSMPHISRRVACASILLALTVFGQIQPVHAASSAECRSAIDTMVAHAKHNLWRRDNPDGDWECGQDCERDGCQADVLTCRKLQSFIQQPFFDSVTEFARSNPQLKLTLPARLTETCPAQRGLYYARCRGGYFCGGDGYYCKHDDGPDTYPQFMALDRRYIDYLEKFVAAGGCDVNQRIEDWNKKGTVVAECKHTAAFIRDKKTYFEQIQAAGKKYGVPVPSLLNVDEQKCEDYSFEPALNVKRISDYVAQLKNFLAGIDAARIEINLHIDRENGQQSFGPETGAGKKKPAGSDEGINRNSPEYREKMRMMGKAREIIGKMETFLTGIQEFRPSLKKALKLFTTPSLKEYLASSEQDIKKALDELKIAHTIVEGFEVEWSDTVGRRCSSSSIAKITSSILGLMRENERSAEIMHSILSGFSYGKYDKAIQQRVKDIISMRKKGELTNQEFASSFAHFIAGSRTCLYDDAAMARMGELQNGFLLRTVGGGAIQGDFHIACSQRGLCGFTHDLVWHLAGTKSDFDRAHQWFVGSNYPIHGARDLLEFIRPKGMLRGEPYVCDKPDVLPACKTETVVATVRTLPGGLSEAMATFNFFATGNTVYEGKDPKTGNAYKKIILKDRTKVILRPTKGYGAVLTVSDIPSDVFDQKILEWRFSPLSLPLTLKQTIYRINQEKEKLIRRLHPELESLPESERKEKLAYYMNV